MKRSHAMPGSPVSDRFGPRTVVSAWRGITRRQFWITFLLGFALFNYYSLAMDPPDDTWEAVSRCTFAVAAAFAMLLAVVVADRASGMDPDRRGVYAVAVVTGALVGGVLEAPVAVWLRSVLDPPVDVVPSLGAALYIGLELVMLGGGVVWSATTADVRSWGARARTPRNSSA